MEGIVHEESYTNIASFHPKVKGLITTHYEDGYLRIEDSPLSRDMDSSIDNYVRDLRLSARRSRGSNMPISKTVKWGGKMRGTIEKSWDGGVAEVTYFRISRAISLLHTVTKGKTKGLNVIDMSAGWGDRLIACLKLGMNYTGVDPSSLMQERYQEMIRDHSPVSGTDERYQASVTCLPFEDYEITGKYDIAFTSPPFYDVEIYSNEDTQSTSRYKDFVSWMKDFLLPSIRKLVASLKDRGILILHLGDSEYVQLAEPAVLYLLSSFPHLSFIGVIGIGNGKTYRPTWIFQVDQEEENNQDYFSYYYPYFVGYHERLDQEFNPPLRRKEIVVDRKKKYYLYDDSSLIGGTKQRAAPILFRHNTNAKRFVYAGPIAGMACVALSYLCSIFNKKCKLYLQGDHEKHRKSILRYGGKIVNPNHELLMSRYNTPGLAGVQKMSLDESKNTDYVVPFGFDNVIFIEELISRLKESIVGEAPDRCWIAFGSGVLLRVLSKVWPITKFCAVVVGRYPHFDKYDEDILSRTTFYSYEKERGIKFMKKTKTNVPYDTILEYDGKVWDMMMQYGKNGDSIWNVGK
jgi:hypothetical protein